MEAPSLCLQAHFAHSHIPSQGEDNTSQSTATGTEGTEDVLWLIARQQSFARRLEDKIRAGYTVSELFES